jgi:hypothetical protein
VICFPCRKKILLGAGAEIGRTLQLGPGSIEDKEGSGKGLSKLVVLNKIAE